MLNSTSIEISSELEWSRTAYPDRAFLLLEGYTDRALIEEYRDTDCRLIITGSKEKSIEVLGIVRGKDALQGVAAIIDLDCWIVTGADELNDGNLLYDDTPDLETMLLDSPALHKLLRNSMTGKDPSRAAQFADELRQSARRLGLECGRFRTVDCFNKSLGLELSVLEDDLNYLLDLSSLRFDRSRAAQKLTGGLQSISQSQLLGHVESLAVERGQIYIRGKDILSILVLIFPVVYRKYFNDEDLLLKLQSDIEPRGNEAMYSKLQSILRQNYESTYLAGSMFFTRIKNWESDNSPFRILRVDI